MSRERAETHLLPQAEAELRRATMSSADSTGRQPCGIPRSWR